jgi:lipopolysaccharide biosynthesis protein
MIGSYHVSKQGMGRLGKIAVKYHISFIDILEFHLGYLKDKE